MRKKNIVIIALLCVGAVLFGIVQFIIVPNNNAQKEAFEKAQLDPLTHDIKYIEEYKSKYMGDASNIINLYSNLPLADVSHDFEMKPDDLKLIVNYKETVSRIGEKQTQGKLIYNATVSFALIDNLERIVYNFTGDAFEVSRSDVEAFYPDWDRIMDNVIWDTQVRNKLGDPAYVSEIFDALFSQPDA